MDSLMEARAAPRQVRFKRPPRRINPHLGGGGYEPWKSDGTAAGTSMVKDIRPGYLGSYPGNLTAVGNAVFFSANDGVHGEELWRSDGTPAGTSMVKDVNPEGTINSGNKPSLQAASL